MHAALLLLLIAPQSNIETFTIDGVKREALIVAPAKKSKNPPLVMAFHGHGGSMRQASRSFQAHLHWPEAVVVYAQGLPTKGRTDPEGKRAGWQKEKGEYGDRDLKLVDAILERVRKDHRVDDKRIYAMGHSNGGRFTYVLWAERGKEFAAFGPSGSPASIRMLRAFPLRSAFLVAGEKDRLVSFVGQKLTADGIGVLLGTDSSKAKVDGHARYEPGKNGLELGTYFHPGGHEYPAIAGRLTIEFFKRHSL